MAKLETYIYGVELDSLTESFMLNRLPLDEDGDVIDDKDTYDFQIEVHGNGLITVHPGEGEDSFIFDPFDQATSTVLKALKVNRTPGS